MQSGLKEGKVLQGRQHALSKEQVTLELHQNEDVSKALRLEDLSRKASYNYRVL